MNTFDPNAGYVTTFFDLLRVDAAMFVADHLGTLLVCGVVVWIVMVLLAVACVRTGGRG